MAVRARGLFMGQAGRGFRVVNAPINRRTEAATGMRVQGRSAEPQCPSTETPKQARGRWGVGSARTPRRGGGGRGGFR
jgi:hypothetical protein